MNSGAATSIYNNNKNPNTNISGFASSVEGTEDISFTTSNSHDNNNNAILEVVVVVVVKEAIEAEESKTKKLITII